MQVRLVNETDYFDIYDLEQKVWGLEGAEFNMIKTRHEVFPQGNAVVEHRGSIVGYASVQRVSAISSDDWHNQTGKGYIKETHKACGHILYGVGMSGSKNGVAELLVEYFYQEFIKTRLCYMIVLGSRVPGYAKWKANTSGSISNYIACRRQDGYSIDPELKVYQKNGFELLSWIDDYFPCRDSLNYGALIVRR